MTNWCGAPESSAGRQEEFSFTKLFALLRCEKRRVFELSVDSALLTQV
jgi:hypothetical protein